MIINFTIPVDFGLRDKTGSVLLNGNKTQQFVIDCGFQLVAGAVVRLSDDEMTAYGTLENRDGVWVATDLKWEPF